MSGGTKGSKGSKGSKGLKGSKRRQLANTLPGVVVKPAIRRLLRRAGVKRIQHAVYAEAQTELKLFLADVVRDAIAYCEHGNRRIVTSIDVVHALKRMGKGLFGYGGYGVGADQ